MEQIHTIRLEGGPYDGDHGELDLLPPYLWAFPCRCDVKHEGINGIHWAWGDDRSAASEPDAQEYRYDRPDAGAHIYGWHQPTLNLNVDTREAVPS